VNKKTHIVIEPLLIKGQTAVKDFSIKLKPPGLEEILNRITLKMGFSD
jgi:hypothetical protein